MMMMMKPFFVLQKKKHENVYKKEHVYEEYIYKYIII